MEDVLNKYVGQILDGRYKIVGTLGKGGMANVFLAQDLKDGKHRAIKMLKESVANDTTALQRFITESRAYAILNHDNIVKIYDISVKGTYKYLVMEYVPGITLKKYISEKGALDWLEVVQFTIQILQALECAHSIPVIHRDIKPQNIMLLKGGIVKVMDFGIAKIPNAQTLTMMDKAIGTVYYISPEQATGSGNVDARSDIYSLGIMMYEMVTGKLPYVAEDQHAVLYKHISSTPTPPSRYVPSIPKGLEQIILKAMEKKPDDRYQSATQMIRHLKQLLQNPSITFDDDISNTNTFNLKPLDRTKETQPIETPIFDTTDEIDIKKKRNKDKTKSSLWILGLLAAVLVIGASIGLVILFGQVLS